MRERATVRSIDVEIREESRKIHVAILRATRIFYHRRCAKTSIYRLLVRICQQSVVQTLRRDSLSRITNSRAVTIGARASSPASRKNCQGDSRSSRRHRRRRRRRRRCFVTSRASERASDRSIDRSRKRSYLATAVRRGNRVSFIPRGLNSGSEKKKKRRRNIDDASSSSPPSSAALFKLTLAEKTRDRHRGGSREGRGN